MPSLRANSITLESFSRILARYETTVPERLHDLDSHRYTSIPAALAKRSTDEGSPYLTKPEVEKLVEWKLKHGTFRPKLLQLVQSNSIEDIEKTTTKAFQLLSGPQSQKPENLDADAVQAGVKLLASLKGIGPATASLLLAVFAPESVPFFSDELFRWVMWEESGKPDGWKRVIKYNLKEYAEVFGRVQELRRRLGVRAVDAERVAWVLGKEGVDVGGVDQGAGCGEEGKKVEAKVGAVGEVQKKVESKKGAKRKVDEDTVQEPKAKQKKKDAPRTDTTQLRRSGRNKDD